LIRRRSRGRPTTRTRRRPSCSTRQRPSDIMKNEIFGPDPAIFGDIDSLDEGIQADQTEAKAAWPHYILSQRKAPRSRRSFHRGGPLPAGRGVGNHIAVHVASPRSCPSGGRGRQRLPCLFHGKWGRRGVQPPQGPPPPDFMQQPAGNPEDGSTAVLGGGTRKLLGAKGSPANARPIPVRRPMWDYTHSWVFFCRTFGLKGWGANRHRHRGAHR